MTTYWINQGRPFIQMSRIPKDISYDEFDNPRFYEDFNTWCEDHPRISTYFSLIRENEERSPTKQPFSQKRESIHKRLESDLQSFLEKLEQEGANIMNELESSQHFNIEVPILIYDSKKGNLMCRQYAYLQQMVFDCQTSILSQKMYSVMEKQTDTRSLISLLDAELIPDDAVLHVSPSFLTLNFSNFHPKTNPSLASLKQSLKHKTLDIAQLKPPLWSSNFQMFFDQLLVEFEPNIMPTMYVPPQEIEISLTRCFLFRGLPFRKQIKKIQDTAKQNISRAIYDLCDSIIPDKTKLSKEKKAVAILVLYRNIFEIFYCIRQDLMKKTPPEMFEKLEKISNLPASLFSLPDNLLNESCREKAAITPLKEFIFLDPLYLPAIDALKLAFFVANPLDALFYVHTSLTEINKAARQNFALISNENPETIKQVFAFDDIFFLFFAVFMACDMQDVFTLTDFINSYSPNCLSSSFEFAQATLEALCIHCKDIDADSLLRKIDTENQSNA